MKIDFTKIVCTTIGVAAVLLLVWLLGFTAKRTDRQTEPTEQVRYDTIVEVRYDTIREHRTIRKDLHHYDTIVLHDTVYIADIPQDYVDSTADYRLRVQAVKMYDYSLNIYRTDTLTRYVPQEATGRKRKGKWGQSIVVGLQAGYGLGVQPTTMQARFEPYVGIGVTYGFGYSW